MATKAKVQNKNGRQGEGGGAKPKYTAKELADTLLAYFDSCTNTRTMPNKAGLRIFLNISADTYAEYKKKYPDAMKGVEDWIENAWIQRLGGTTPTGAIFYLKNAFGYRDKQEITGAEGGPVRIDISSQLLKVYGGDA